MADKTLKEAIANVLITKHKFGPHRAQKLIAQHIDAIEANEDDMDAEGLADIVEELYVQDYDEDED